MSESTVQFVIRNPRQDSGQEANLADALSTTEPLSFPGIEYFVELEYPTTSGQTLGSEARQRPLFGNHIREAIAIVKDWARNG